MALDEVEQREYMPKDKKQPSEEDEKRKKKLTPGSLMKAIIRPGGGDATPVDGDQVIYHCTTRTLDGVVVYSSKYEYGGKGYPIRQVLGKSKMILGLSEGIPTMLEGEVAMFKMKPEIHYAEDECPVAAPDSFPIDDELHFEIEMLDFSKAKVVTEDLGIVKKITTEGQGWECPREPYEVISRIAAKAGNGQPLLPHKPETYCFTFGKSEVPKGLEMAIGTMTRGERAVIFVSKTYLTSSPLLQIEEDIEEINFEVELAHFAQVRDVLGDGRLIKRRVVDGRGLNFQEIMDEADKIKNTGNRLFKEGKYGLAKAKYEKVLREYNHVNPNDDDEGKIFLNSRNTLQLNVAACLQKMGEYRKSIEMCNKVMDANPVHVKALYRRGMSYMLLGEFDEAKNDFNKMISVDKSSEADANAALLKLKQTQQEMENKARKQFKGLFDKKPGEISEVGTEIKKDGLDHNKQKSQNEESINRDIRTKQSDGQETLIHEEKVGLLGRLWPFSGRFFSALGLNKCTIL